MGGAGVKPAVQGIRLLLKAGLAAAVGAGEVLGKDVRGVQLKPGVGALLAEEGGDGGNGLVRAYGLAAVLAVHHGDGQAPAALAADAPVAALPDHALHPVNAPAGHPAHVYCRGAVCMVQLATFFIIT